MTIEKQVTSLQQIKLSSQGEVVELSPFPDGTPFVARLRKPNIMSLIRYGKIPNELLGLLTSVNEKQSPASKSPQSDVFGLKQSLELQEVFCKSCLVEPSWSDIEACGGGLTDTQIAEIALYAQGGIEALKSFREQSRNHTDSSVSKVVSEVAE